MKKKLIPILIAVGLLGGGAALVIVADRQGWLTGLSSETSAQECPHGMPVDQCPFCDKTLIEKMGFCSGHGVPEALCTKCNPAVIVAFKSTGDWCAEHNIPESQCTICNPDLTSSREGEVKPASPPPSVELVRRPQLPRSQRPPSVTCRTNTVKIQIRSPEIARAAGLEYVRVKSRDVTETLLCNAEITYDANRYARLSSRAPGVVREVSKDLGQTVTKGETLAIVNSSDLGLAKAAYLQAMILVNLREKNYAPEKTLLESKISSKREALEAETKLVESRVVLSGAFQRLSNLGLSDAEVKEVSRKQDTSSLLRLLAPFPGVVVERSGVIGEVVDVQKPLLGIADISVMWAMLDIYESDLLKIRSGQPVVFEAEGLPGEQRGGRITWVSSHVDRRTRTLKARAEIASPDGLLRSGMFGKAIVSLRKNEAALVVPKESVQWEGCCNVVFVRRSNMLFEPRKVRLGHEMEQYVVIESGVVEGEEIVTTGSFLLKTEILKGSIGAGCCEVDPGKK